MEKIRKTLNSYVDIKANGYGIMGIAAVSLYGAYALIRDTIVAFMELFAL